MTDTPNIDDALFPVDGGPDLGLLVRLVAAMIALYLLSSGLGIRYLLR